MDPVHHFTPQLLDMVQPMVLMVQEKQESTAKEIYLPCLRKCRWFLQYRWIWSWRWSHFKAATEIIIEPNILVSANGGDGSDTSAAGTGGSIRLEATRIFNHGTLQAKAGNGATYGYDQTRGSSGGRIALIANGAVKVGNTDVSGEWLSNNGEVFVGGSYLIPLLEVENADLTIDTSTGYFSVEGRFSWVRCVFISFLHR